MKWPGLLIASREYSELVFGSGAASLVDVASDSVCRVCRRRNHGGKRMD
ncbi:MAG: hypothetical protein R3C19_27295 [Planctomycetaceae bacterium]